MRDARIRGVPAPPAQRAPKKSKAGTGFKLSGLPQDKELFERLRALRRSISDKLGVPPYVVFHDSALMEMSAIKPKTLEALRSVKGVGELKLVRYGPAFLEAIAANLTG